MILELIVALIVGIIAGTFTGLSPGIHINLITAILLSISSLSFISSLNPIVPVIFVVSMAITHTFLDFIPSIFLGAPDEDSFLSVLPGHQLLKSGFGYEAVLLTLFGSLFSLITICLFLPIFLFALPKIFPVVKSIIPFVILFASFYLILREKSIINSGIIFFLSGFLGLLTFNLPVQEPMLPLLSGLFGASAIIISIKNKTKIPKQIIIPLRKFSLPKNILKISLVSALVSPLASFLPGMGSGHAAVFGSEISEQSNKSFLFLLGSINTIVMALSFITIYSIGKTRTGASLAVLTLLPEAKSLQILLIITTILSSGILSFILGIAITKFASTKITSVNYTFLSITILLVLLIVNIFFSNFLGLLILLASTALGVTTIQSNVKRIQLMGSLILPTILFYFL